MSDAMVLHLQEQVDALKQENARLREALKDIRYSAQGDSYSEGVAGAALGEKDD